MIQRHCLNVQPRATPTFGLKSMRALCRDGPSTVQYIPSGGWATGIEAVAEASDSKPTLAVALGGSVRTADRTTKGAYAEECATKRARASWRLVKLSEARARLQGRQACVGLGRG